MTEGGFKFFSKNLLKTCNKCVFIIPAAGCYLFVSGCLTLWIIRTAARRRPMPKGEVVVVGRTFRRWRGEVMPANRYRSLILSYTRSAAAARHPTTRVPFRSCIIGGRARGCPPPSFFPYGVRIHIIYTPSVRLPPPPPPSP